MKTNYQKKIRIDMWGDFMCPICYIGKVNLEHAICEFQHKENIELVYRPFQLYPDAPVNNMRNYYEYTAMTHGGLSVEYVKEANKNVIAMAKSAGLNYNLDILIPTNTMDALRISQFAQEQGKAQVFTSRIYRAYFEEGLNIGDPQTLADLGSEVGLDPKNILQILIRNEYKQLVESDRQYAVNMGVRGTPFYVVSDKYSISGIQAKEAFLGILDKVWVEA